LAAADFAYEKKREDNPETYIDPPPELLIAFDWIRFHTPPRAGGLADQPLLLLHRIRTALNTYENVKAYRTAHSNLGEKALTKWYAQNGKLMKFMEYIWRLQNPDG